MTDKLPLTICILTNRADERFFQALESAQWAQEVLVIDYQSGNDWPQLAQKYQFTLHESPGPILDFAQERNWALKQAQSDWVLFLDSDEMLAQDTEKKLRKILDQPNVQAASLIRTDIFHGKQLRFGEAGRQRQIRVMRPTAVHFERPVHERPVVAGRVMDSDAVIWHYAHLNITEFLADVARYAHQEAAFRELSPAMALLQLLVWPPAKFVYNYLLKLGFLDGWRGLVYAVMMSLHSLLVRVFALELALGAAQEEPTA